jgi:hypothetical protein
MDEFLAHTEEIRNAYNIFTETSNLKVYCKYLAIDAVK